MISWKGESLYAEAKNSIHHASRSDAIVAAERLPICRGLPVHTYTYFLYSYYSQTHYCADYCVDYCAAVDVAQSADSASGGHRKRYIELLLLG